MSTTWLRSEPDTGSREPPALSGFEYREGMLQLRADYYRQFVTEVTGIELTSELSATEPMMVRSRLEGCIETYERDGECACDEFSRYEHVDSIETVHELARFFRALAGTPVENTHTA